jgi:hypothetical protein
VREIVYLSDSKLKNIIPTSRPWWQRLRAASVTGEVGVGPIKVGAEVKIPDPDEMAALAASIDKADTLGQSSKWFGDPTLTAGELMWFEGRLGCHLVKLGAEPAAVLFCQLPEPNCRSVVLHGSAKNVTHWEQEAAGAGHLAYSDPMAVPDILRGAVTAEEGGPPWRFCRGLGRASGPMPADDLTRNLTTLYRDVVSDSWFRSRAGYFSGFAYTSGIVPLPDGTEIVLGSPLYVMRARPEA